MDEAIYNILILVGYVGFAYVLQWSVDRLWLVYVDWCLQRMKNTSNGVTTRPRSRVKRGQMSRS